MGTKKTFARNRIKRRVRGKVHGTAECPRLSVFRSNKQIYAQIIDDRFLVYINDLFDGIPNDVRLQMDAGGDVQLSLYADDATMQIILPAVPIMPTYQEQQRQEAELQKLQNIIIRS